MYSLGLMWLKDFKTSGGDAQGDDEGAAADGTREARGVFAEAL